jgi:HlyD family secretion protein
MHMTRLARILFRHILLPAGILALAGAGLWYGFRATEIRAAEVTLRDLAPTVQGVGTVEAKVLVQVGAKITGRLTAVLVDQGDPVRPGQVLARLEDSEAAALVEQADAALRRARLAVATQEVALRKAQAAFGAAEAAVGRVRATERLAGTNALRWQQLHADGGVSRADMDVKVTEAAAARADLKSVEASRQTAQEEVALLRASLDAAHQDVRVAEAGLRAVRARQADTIITAAVTGIVISRELEPGATVSPGTPILKIADPQSAWVTVHVDERESGGIAIGNPADISLRSQPTRPLPGRVARIRRESDRVTEQLAVDVAFETPPTRVTFGEQAEARIRPEGERAATVMPLAALVRTADGPATVTIEENRLRLRPIRTGLVDPTGWIQVRDGLRSGERVVLAPGRLASPKYDGQRVRIENEKPTTDNAK